MLTGARLQLWQQLQQEKQLQQSLNTDSWDQDTQNFIDSLNRQPSHLSTTRAREPNSVTVPVPQPSPQRSPMIDNTLDTNEFVLSDAPSHTGYSSEDSGEEDMLFNNPDAIRLPETDSIVDGDLLPSDATPGTSTVPPSTLPAQESMSLEEVEEDGKWVHGASPFYSSLVKKIIVNQGYSLEPSAYPVVSLCSDNEKPVSQTYRLPSNPYILGRLEQYRQQVIDDTSSKPSTKHFPRPPVSLERVAELGDPVSQKSVSSSVSRAIRKVPQPPDVWNYMLADHIDTTKQVHPVIKLEKAQARQMELSVIWALKGANYVDHFTMYQKQMVDKLKDKVLGLQSWAANTESPEKVQSVISAILAGVQENRQVLDESQDIFKSIVNALVFQKGVLEFSRRDSLDYFISRLVTEHTRNQLRNSQFSNRHCYDPDLCAKARKEYVDNKNLREIRGRRQNQSFQGKNKGSNNNNNNSGFYKPKPYTRSFPKRPTQQVQQQGDRAPSTSHNDRGKQQHGRGGHRGGRGGAPGGYQKRRN